MSEKFTITLPCAGARLDPDLTESALREFVDEVLDSITCYYEVDLDGGDLGDLRFEIDLEELARHSVRVKPRALQQAQESLAEAIGGGGTNEAKVTIGEVREFWLAAHPGETLADWATAVVREAMTAAQADGVLAQATGLPLDGEADTDSHPDDCQSDEIHIEEDE